MRHDWYGMVEGTFFLKGWFKNMMGLSMRWALFHFLRFFRRARLISNFIWLSSLFCLWRVQKEPCFASYIPTPKTRWVIGHRRWVWPPPIQIDVGLQGRLAWRATCHSAKPTDIHCWSGSAHVKRAPCQSEPVRTWNLLSVDILATGTRRTIGAEEREGPCSQISKMVRFQRRGTRSRLLNLYSGYIWRTKHREKRRPFAFLSCVSTALPNLPHTREREAGVAPGASRLAASLLFRPRKHPQFIRFHSSSGFQVASSLHGFSVVAIWFSGRDWWDWSL